jgi:glycosyltransferase involved in cell wall biosynthesis
MAKILNIIQILTLGGAARALIATAKYSRIRGGFEHSVLSLLPPEPRAVALARESGIRVIAAPNKADLQAELAAADIVQLHWWNVPENTDFLNGALPPMRLMNYYHVCGDQLPHIITPLVLGMADFNVACNPYTYLDNPAFRDMDPEMKARSTGMVYGAADFARMAGFRPKPHEGFNIGYVGTIDFIKMHPDYIKMSAAIRIPEAKFIVCGDGSLDVLRHQAKELGVAERFEIRGYIEDVRGAIGEFDVYGYPLCEETYAGSELNLQEVMFAGLAPVVFPYGGVKRLVVNDFTGIIVNSASEYCQAIEYLYHHPAERRRLGANARAYSEQIFGAENAAAKINALYTKMLERPKRNRERFLASLPVEEGSLVLIKTLGETGEAFRASRAVPTLEDAWRADVEIQTGTRLLFISGIGAYRGRYPNDPYLRFWAGLFFSNQGSHAEAAMEFLEALKYGFPHWRIHWRLYLAAKEIGHADLMKNALAMLEKSQPDYKIQIERITRPPREISPVISPKKSPLAPVIASGPSSSLTLSPEKEISEQAEKLFLTGMKQEAETLLENALVRMPGSAKIMNDLGAVLHARGDKTRARKLFLEAIRTDERNVEAALNLGDSLVEAGLKDDALGLYYRYLDFTPDDKDLLLAAGHLEEEMADRRHRTGTVRDLNYRPGPYRVSALVSTYNSADFIRECLEDLEGQTIARDLEIIVVDAASPGKEDQIVEEFQRQFTNIRYIRTSERIGIYPAWNLAIRVSSGQFMTPMSTNDRLAPDAYEKLIKTLEENPKAALAYGDTYLTSIPHEVFGRHTPASVYGGAFQWPAYSYEDLLVSCRVGPHPMWKKSIHSEIGYFDGRYAAIGDQDFWLRLAINHPLIHFPVFTGLAWITKDSLSGQGSSMEEILDIHTKHTAAYLERVRQHILRT